MIKATIFSKRIFDAIEKCKHFYATYRSLPGFRRALSLSSPPKVELNGFKDKRVLLPLIETSHYKFIQLLIIARALKLRGAEVYVLVCDQHLSACEIRSVQRSNSDICWYCKFNRNKLLPLFGLTIISLNDFSEEIDYNNFESKLGIIQKEFPQLHTCVEDSVIRHFYGNVPPDSDQTAKVRKQHLITAMKSWTAAKKIYADFDINLVLGYMIAYSEFAPYYNFFKRENIPFKIISSTQFDGRAQIFNWPELYESLDRFYRYIRFRGNDRLDENEKKELFDFINKRKSGLDPVLTDLGIAKNAATDLTKFGIRIGKSKKNIFLFSNVFWDVGMSELNSIFSSIPEWIFETINVVANVNECHLYIRCHPAEKINAMNGQRGMREMILEEFPNMAPNITIIASDNEVSSYDLFPYIDLGIIYNGTIGVEMLLEDIPVLVAGKAPYSGLKSVVFPQTIKEYTDSLLNKVDKNRLDQNEIQLFSFFYLLKTSVPWTLTKKAYPAQLLDPLKFSDGKSLMPDGDRYLDHLCNCLVDDELSPEFW